MVPRGEERVQHGSRGQKLLFPYKAPLSRTILFEWLRKMPNWELGIAVSSAAVSFDRRKNSFSLPPLSPVTGTSVSPATLPTPAPATPVRQAAAALRPQRHDCAGKLWLLFPPRVLFTHRVLWYPYFRLFFF